MPQTIATHIDHLLRLDPYDLPEGALAHLKDALEIPNLEKAKAKKMDQFGWQQLPDTIQLWSWDMDNKKFAMPRGFLPDLADGLLENFGVGLHLIEHRQVSRHAPIGAPIVMLPWQVDMVNALDQWEQGILKAPAGSGKTVAILAAIQSFATKSLIIVNTKDIMWQWQKRAEAFLPEYPPCGQIGDGVFKVSDGITVATAQTLHSRYDELEAQGFFDAFSFVCLDECHHATAATYNRLLGRFSARYRVGVSATPDKTGDFLLAQMVLGSIIHEVKPSEVTTLIKPKVVKVETDFDFNFRPHKSRRQPSNYSKMIIDLISDEERNRTILKRILLNHGHYQLLVTKRLEHIQWFAEALKIFSDPVWILTGSTSNEQREAIVAQANTTPGILLSTLADEALDIPRLDRLHLAYPQRNTGLITQQVGRVERVHPQKRDALVFDYVDANIGVLKNQWNKRRNEVYWQRGYEMTTDYRKA